MTAPGVPEQAVRDIVAAAPEWTDRTAWDVRAVLEAAAKAGWDLVSRARVAAQLQDAGRHEPAIAPAGRPGEWGVYCTACSHEDGDYVYPCRRGWIQEIPPSVVAEAGRAGCDKCGDMYTAGYEDGRNDGDEINQTHLRPEASS